MVTHFSLQFDRNPLYYPAGPYEAVEFNCLLDGGNTMGGTPGWFRAHMQAAKEGGWNSQCEVRNSYKTPGYHLGLHWGEQLLDGEDEKLVQDELHKLLERRECAPAEMMPILEKYFTRFLDLVPPRRRDTFTKGFIDGVREVEGLC